MIKKKRLEIAWKQLQQACKQIADGLRDQPIDCVVGISRGGLIPATILAHELNIRKVVSYGMKSYDGDFAGEQIVYQNCFEESVAVQNASNILIVDDISDKGNTFINILKDAKECNFEGKILTASIFIRSNTLFVPNHYSQQVESEWVVFPYEK